MKPADHPDFFRLSPPQGVSRESTLRLDRVGSFWHDGERVERESLSRALHRWVSRHPDDDRPILTNGYDWCYFAVDGTLRFIDSIRLDEDHARLMALLADGRELHVVADSITVDSEGHCYARLEGERDMARFSRLAQAALGPWLREDEQGSIVLELGANTYPLVHSSVPVAVPPEHVETE